MKTIVFIFFIFVQHTIYAQKNDTLRKYLDGNFALTSRNQMVYPAISFKSNDHWVLYSTYADNKPLIVAYFSDKELTIKDGPYTIYFPNNQKAAYGYYKNGRKLGVWKYWYENGNLKDSGMIINNQLVNAWHTWYATGTLMMIIDYASADSLIDSETGIKKRIGQKISVIDNIDLAGYKNGRFTRYYPNGVTSESGHYQKNNKHGLWQIWFQNGQIEATGNFSNDSLQGEWIWYRENGVMATKETYRNGKLVSVQCYDENGVYSGDYCSILKPPVPLGNYVDFKDYLLDNIILPKELADKKLEGVVTITCTITKDGKMTAIDIQDCPYDSLRKEIEKFFLSIKEWSPAILHNRPTDYSFKYILPLSVPVP